MLTLSGEDLPSVSVVARETPDFKILISTIISLRTKDAVTLAASERLFALADTPEAVSKLNESAIAEAIYPAGFYKTKAKTIKSVSEIILSSHGGRVPASLDAPQLPEWEGRRRTSPGLG
jgi:endonuclease-3